jgi:hypothetical protein
MKFPVAARARVERALMENLALAYASAKGGVGGRPETGR